MIIGRDKNSKIIDCNDRETRSMRTYSHLSIHFMLHIVWSIVVGFIVGLIASAIMHTHLGFVGTTLLGIVGSELKDLFSAEQQLVKALPKMAKAASNKELAAGFQEHLEQTKEHAQRLEQILSSHKQTTRGPKCKGMEGDCR